VISSNRERWTEALRDAVAEYVALLLSVSVVKENIGQNPLKAVTADHGLLEIVQRIILVKNKILLMTNPADSRYQELCNVNGSSPIEGIWRAAVSADIQRMNSITRFAFAVAMLAATTLWMAGRPAVTDQSDPLNPGATPLHFTYAIRAAYGPGDGTSETDAGEDPDSYRRW
jgi:hypothetical protein